MDTTARVLRSDFQQPLITVATALQYDKLARLRRESPTFDDEFSLRILMSSTRDTNSLLFFPGEFYEIGPFGAKAHYFRSRGVAATNSYILHLPDLNEKFLRRLFTGIELVAFKLCHLAIENQRRDYHFESEHLRQRIRKLKRILTVEDWNQYVSTFDEIQFTRDAFVHSFIELEEIPYKRVPLAHCFGYTSVGQRGTHDVSFEGKYFVDDVRYFFEPISQAFIERQLGQIDEHKFFRLCDQALKKRSLAR
jgi:hypothetical protein